MKLAGSHDLPFQRRAVWEALMDPEVLSRTLPGCEQLEESGDNAFAGRLKVNVGPVRGEFRGTLTLSDLDPPQSYRMRLDGQGPSGFMNGEGTVRLEVTDGGTRLHYDLDAQVGGRIAGVGQRVLDSSARSVARQGLEGLERQLAARHGAAQAQAREAEKKAAETKAATVTAGEGSALDAAVATGDAPSQASFAASVARDVLADLVPPARRVWLAAGVGFVSGLIVGLLVALLL